MEWVDDELTLRDYVALFRRHWWILVAALILPLGLSVAYSLTAPPVYRSTATVLLRTQFNQNLFPSVGDSLKGDFGRNGRAEFDYAQSGAMRALTKPATPAGTHVSVRYDEVDESSPQNSSNFLDFVAESGDPEASMEGANAWAQIYLDSRQDLALAEVVTTIELVAEQIAELEEEKAELLDPIAPIDRALLRETESDAIARLSTQRLTLLQSLGDDLQPVQAKLRTLNDDLSSLEIRASFLERGSISARVNSAAGPGIKVGPNVGRNVILAAFVGLMVGVAAVLVRESIATTIETTADVNKALPGLPVMAEIPPIEAGELNSIESLIGAHTPYAEAIERLVNGLGLLSKGGSGNRFLFTSPLPSEGKTTVVAHCALRLALGGEKVAAVDADLRRPRLHEALEVDNTTEGVSQVLAGDAELFPSIIKLGPENLVRLLPAGPTTNVAASLFRSSSAPLILAKMAAVHDVVLVDSPPVLPVADAVALAASSIDHVIMVVRAGQTSHADLVEAVSRLAAAGRSPVAVVMTNASGGATAYNYDYSVAPTQLEDADS